MIHHDIVKPNPKKSGFTIVELLVVIVVIGILAAITIVSYTGISSRATVSSLQSDLTNALTQLKLDQVSNSMFPSSLAAANGGKGISSSSGTSYTYAVSNTTTPQTFCITATKNNISYNITGDGNSQPGICPVLNLDAGDISSYPGTGTTWTDLSGNGNSGTLYGGVTYSGANGGVLSFDGVNGYTQILNSASVNSTSISVSLWVNIQSDLNCDAGNNWRSLMYKGTSTSGTSTGFDIVVEESRAVAWDTGTGVSDRWWPSGLVIPLSSWSNLVLVYDEYGKKAAYLNGSLIGLKSITAAPLASNGNSLYINNPSIACPSGSGGIPGYINDVRVYSKALDADEVIQNFNNKRGRYGI